MQKFRNGGFRPIPVIHARIKDFDVVYSAHVAAYGSIPATLWPSPGTWATVFVNWLDPAQEARMHATEVPSGNYHFGRIDGVEIRMERGGALTSAFAYMSRRGALQRDGRPIALAAVVAENRRWPALGQEEVQAHLRDRLAPGRPLEPFIRAAIDDIEERRARTASLSEWAETLAIARFTILDV
jgi:hypothetical protein